MITDTDKAWIDGYFEGLESAQNVRNDQSLHTPIDPESKAFIKWSLKRLSQPDYYYLVTSLIETQVKTFLHSNPQLIPSLKQKLSKGAREHGKPSYSLGQIEQELNNELLDLIGWNMLRLWMLRKESKC
jgi:hypothetical protein